MRIAFVPSAPFLLFPRPRDRDQSLWEAIDAAVAHLGPDPVVVGAAPRPGWWQGSADLTSFGERQVRQDPLPLALGVGRTLLGHRPHRLWGVPADGLPEADLLVVADGTAKRTPKAPGAFDARAEAFDRQVQLALETGDARSLGQLDEALAAELWVGGLDAWRAVSGLAGPWQARVLYADAPHGVGYVVATWQD